MFLSKTGQVQRFELEWARSVLGHSKRSGWRSAGHVRSLQRGLRDALQQGVLMGSVDATRPTVAAQVPVEVSYYGKRRHGPVMPQ